MEKVLSRNFYSQNSNFYKPDEILEFLKECKLKRKEKKNKEYLNAHMYAYLKTLNIFRIDLAFEEGYKTMGDFRRMCKSFLTGETV